MGTEEGGGGGTEEGGGGGDRGRVCVTVNRHAPNAW